MGKQERLFNNHSQFLTQVHDFEKFLLNCSRKLTTLSKASIQDNLNLSQGEADIIDDVTNEEVRSRLENMQVSVRVFIL